jgi:hypothetical protein
VGGAFGWTLLRSNSKGKQHEVAWNKGCLGEFETAFDGEVEAITDILEYIMHNQVPGYVTIHSDPQAAIARGQDRAIRIAWHRVGEHVFEWVPGHTGIAGNERAIGLLERQHR